MLDGVGFYVCPTGLMLTFTENPIQCQLKLKLSYANLDMSTSSLILIKLDLLNLDMYKTIFRKYKENQML